MGHSTAPLYIAAGDISLGGVGRFEWDEDLPEGTEGGGGGSECASSDGVTIGALRAARICWSSQVGS